MSDRQLRKEIAGLRKQVQLCKKEIQSQMDWWELIPMGVDYECDPWDTSPRDATAHLGGIAWQSAKKTLATLER